MAVLTLVQDQRLWKAHGAYFRGQDYQGGQMLPRRVIPVMTTAITYPGPLWVTIVNSPNVPPTEAKNLHRSSFSTGITLLRGFASQPVCRDGG